MKVGLNSVQLQGWRHQGIQLHLQDQDQADLFLEGEEAEKVSKVCVSCDVISVL